MQGVESTFSGASHQVDSPTAAASGSCNCDAVRSVMCPPCSNTRQHGQVRAGTPSPKTLTACEAEAPALTSQAFACGSALGLSG